MNLIPLFDTDERLRKAIEYQDYEPNLKQHGLERKVFLLPEGAPENVANGFIPQDAYGGHQQNAHLERWATVQEMNQKACLYRQFIPALQSRQDFMVTRER